MLEYKISTWRQLIDIRPIGSQIRIYKLAGFIRIHTHYRGLLCEDDTEFLIIHHVMAHYYDELTAFGVDPRDEHAESFLSG